MRLKIVAGVLAVLLYIPIGLLGADYIAGAMFYVTNKLVPEEVSVDTWPDSWRAYSENPTQRKRLQLSAGMGLFALFGLPLVLVLSVMTRARSLHGDARFASPAEIAGAGLYGDNGVIVGKYGRRYLIYGGQEFVLLAAPTRSGKGVSIVLPNLLNFNESVVVLDIKMENFAYTSKFRQMHGQEVFLFNPFGTDNRSHRWNPLDAVHRDPNLRVGEIQAIGHVLYPAENVKDAFWNESARNLFLGLCLYLLESPTLPCSLGELLRQASGKGQPIKEYLQGLMTKRGTGDQRLSDDCTGALQRFCTTSENTMAGILATFTAPLTMFSNPIERSDLYPILAGLPFEAETAAAATTGTPSASVSDRVVRSFTYTRHSARLRQLGLWTSCIVLILLAGFFAYRKILIDEGAADVDKQKKNAQCIQARANLKDHQSDGLSYHEFPDTWNQEYDALAKSVRNLCGE